MSVARGLGKGQPQGQLRPCSVWSPTFPAPDSPRWRTRRFCDVSRRWAEVVPGAVRVGVAQPALRAVFVGPSGSKTPLRGPTAEERMPVAWRTGDRPKSRRFSRVDFSRARIAFALHEQNRPRRFRKAASRPILAIGCSLSEPPRLQRQSGVNQGFRQELRGPSSHARFAGTDTPDSTLAGGSLE